MSIRAAILIGCLSLTCITGSLGLFDRQTEHEVGALAGTIYDRAFMGMSYLRSAQNSFVRAAAVCPDGDIERCDALRAVLPDILQDLKVAQDRDLSRDGRVAESAIESRLHGLLYPPQPTSGPESAGQLAEIDRAFEMAVEILAADGFTSRQHVASSLARADRENFLAILVSVASALTITALLGTRIVRPLRRAVLVAEAIAAGKVISVDPPEGTSETAVLLRVLSHLALEIAKAKSLEADARDAENALLANAREVRAGLAVRFEATVGAAAAGVIRKAAQQADTMVLIGGQAAISAKGWCAIADATSRTTREAQSASGATVQLSASIGQISKKAEDSAEAAKKAASAVQAMDETVQQLASNATRIGEVAKLISDVAARTKLLALNATIEAARAGVAGRGFAVVAQEVKTLASKTSAAASEVARQVADVQYTTSNAVVAIRQVGQTISKLAGTSDEIAVAVYHQQASTRGIVESMTRVTRQAERVEAELHALDHVQSMLGTTLSNLGVVAAEATTQGKLIQEESVEFLEKLHAA